MNKTKDRNNLIIFCVAITLVLVTSFILLTNMRVFLNSHTFFKNILGEEALFSQVINQSVFLFVIALFGFAILSCFKDILSFIERAFLAIIIGVLAWCFLSQLIVCLGIRYSSLSIITAGALSLTACIFAGKPNISKIEYRKVFYIIITYAALAIFFSSFVIYKYSYDSVQYIGLGERIARNGFMEKAFTFDYTQFPLFVPLIFAPAELFSFEFAHGVYTWFAFGFIAVLIMFIYKDISKAHTKRESLILSLLALLLLLGSGLFMHGTYYIMSNYIAAVTLFLSIYFINKFKHEKSNLFFYLSLFFMICFIWSRIESAFFALAIIFFMTNIQLERKHLLTYIIGCATFSALWYLRILLAFGIHSTEFMHITPNRMLVVMLAFLMLAIYCIICNKFKLISRNKSKIEVLFFVLLGLVIAATFIYFRPTIMTYNIILLSVNAFSYGGWGSTLYIFAALMIIYFKRVKNIGFWEKNLVALFICIFAIFIFREGPLRVGLWDSGNRMLVQTIPIMVYLIATKLFTQFFYRDVK